MKRSRVIIIGVICVYGAVIVFALWPFWNQAENAKVEIAQSRQLVRSRQSESGVNEEEVYTQLQAKADALNRYFLKTKDDVVFFDHIESLAKNQGVIASIRFLQEPAPGKIQNISLEVTIDGPYLSTMSFLSALEVQPFVIQVTDITIQTNDQASGTVRSTVTFQTLWE